MQNIRPIKNLGQNYLTDPNIIRKFVDAVEIGKQDKIVEIGPGKGAITGELYKKTRNIIAVEYDRRVINSLRNMFPEMKIVNTDILKPDIDKLTDGDRAKFVGNIPFNLTSPILFKLMENRKFVSDVIFIVQHEVAKRITSINGSKDYGILSVILNYLYDVKYCFKISRNSFTPKPNVDSAVIHLHSKPESLLRVDFDTFVKVVKSAFGNRRKTLKNSLSNSIFSDCDLSVINFNLDLRAEQLTVEDFIELTNQVKKSVYD